MLALVCFVIDGCMYLSCIYCQTSSNCFVFRIAKFMDSVCEAGVFQLNFTAILDSGLILSALTNSFEVKGMLDYMY